eukprot:scaffold6463_cov69-Phaeocystis_antarctica.AAC.1
MGFMLPATFPFAPPTIDFLTGFFAAADGSGAAAEPDAAGPLPARGGRSEPVQRRMPTRPILLVLAAPPAQSYPAARDLPRTQPPTGLSDAQALRRLSPGRGRARAGRSSLGAPTLGMARADYHPLGIAGHRRRCWCVSRRDRRVPLLCRCSTFAPMLEG